MKPLSSDHETAVRRWVTHAEDDLEMATLGLEAGARGLAQVGFHAQQAVEKMLKAMLAAYGVDPSETHDLGRLCARLAPFAGAVVSQLGPLRDLTPYAVYYRYPPRTESYDRPIDRATLLCDIETARSAVATLKNALDVRLSRQRAAERRPEPISPGAAR